MNETAITEAETEDLQDEALDRDVARASVCAVVPCFCRAS